MAADGRLRADLLSAAGYARGQVPVATGAGGFKPGSAGGGVMGTALAVCTFPTITSNQTSTAATGSVISTSSGTHGMAESAGVVTYCTDNVNSLYIVSGVLGLGTVSSFTASHVHSTFISEWVLEGGLLTLMFDGSGAQYTPVLTMAPFTLDTSGGMAPELAVGSSGGSGLTFTGATLALRILRLAA